MVKHESTLLTSKFWILLQAYFFMEKRLQGQNRIENWASRQLKVMVALYNSIDYLEIARAHFSNPERCQKFSFWVLKVTM